MSLCYECYNDGYNEKRCKPCNGIGYEICECIKTDKPCPLCQDNKKLKCYYCEGFGIIRSLCLFCETILNFHMSLL